MLSSLLVFGAALVAVNAKLPTPRTPPQVIFQSSVSLDNIAVRASSDLLLTSFTSPTLFTFDPKSTNGTLALVHTFRNATTLTGITEYRPGVFAVLSSALNATTSTMNLGSVFLWINPALVGLIQIMSFREVGLIRFKRIKPNVQYHIQCNCNLSYNCGAPITTFTWLKPLQLAYPDQIRPNVLKQLNRR
jgi:hypothetical protein